MQVQLPVLKEPPGPPTAIDPAYVPKVSLARLPATAPTPDILAVLDRDGGLILEDLVTPSQLAAIDDELSPHANPPRNTAIPIIPSATTLIPGLVGKSPTIASICEASVLEQLRTEILEDRFRVLREDFAEENVIDPLLSISTTLHIGYGAPRQRLHRDDNVHGVRHGGAFDLRNASQFGVLIAGCQTTRQNGATMVVPGSHRWDDERVPKLDELCFAEMKPGSALVFLGSCYHGGGANTVPDTVRKMHGLFFVRGTYRQEENQFLAIPPEKVMGMTAGMLKLLGYKKPTTVLGIVENGDPAADLEGVFARMQIKAGDKKRDSVVDEDGETL